MTVEHCRPAPGRVVAFGEVLLRLKSPGHERLLQSAALEATFGGAEMNTVASLARFGVPAAMVTALPENALGDAAVAELQRFRIDTSGVARQGERVGTYYLEAGAAHRPSRVVYDRAWSSFATAERGTFDWDALLDGAGWFHFTGITPAVSATAAEHCLDAARAARAKGIPVSCDFNYRGTLWRWGKNPPEVMIGLMGEVDVAIAGREDIQRMLGIDFECGGGPEGVEPRAYRVLADRIRTVFPRVRKVAITLRAGESASRSGWSAVLRTESGFFVSRRYDLTDMVDRVGGGDAFSAGLIYGMMSGNDDERALEFAVAASCLKHTIPGDVNRVTVAEVEALAMGEGSGRVLR